MCEKGYFWNPAASSCKKGKYAGTIIDDSVVVCHEIEETKNNSTKAIPTNLFQHLPHKTFIKTKTFITISQQQEIKRN